MAGGRARVHVDNAAKQKAYRARKKPKRIVESKADFVERVQKAGEEAIKEFFVVH